MYPKSFQKLIQHFSSLPSVGPKMAERLVLHLFKQNKEKISDFAESLEKIKELKHCPKCFNISEDNLCLFCSDKNRQQDIICVVEEPLDIIAIERTGAFKGLYHVLGGVIFTLKDDNANDLKINELLNRIREEKIQEVIFATNPTTEGDATTLYLKRKIEPLGIKMTKLARGLTAGGDIEYIDEQTLSEALSNRKTI